MATEQAHVIAATPATRRHFWLLMLAALLLLGAGIGLRDPWPSDEPRFTLVAKQMVESGDWLFPRRGTELYSDKPPMLMWLEAASYVVVREWRIAFVLPSLLASLLTIVLTYDLGRRLWNPRTGLYAAGALLCAFQFAYQMKRAQIDPLITCWITIANWGLLLHFLKGPDWRKYWIGCFFAGIGVITKGVGVLALLMFVPYAIARRNGWDVFRAERGSAWRWALGPLLFLLAIALWVVPMVLTVRTLGTPEHLAYMNDILFRQTAKRYVDSWAHDQPFWYYAQIMLINWFPLSLAYFGAFRGWLRDLRARDARILFLLLWTVLVAIFFSIPNGKRNIYMMPALPLVALALAPYLHEMLATRWLRNTAFLLSLLGGLFMIGVGVASLFGYVEQANLMARDRELADGGRLAWWTVVAIGAAFVTAAAWFRPRRGVHALLVGCATLWLVYGIAAHLLLNDSNSARSVMQRAGEAIGPDAELALVAWKEQHMLMADRHVHDFGFTRHWPDQFVDAAKWLAQAPQRRWVFILEDAMGDCVLRDRARFVGRSNRREWWLYQSDAIVPGCVPDAAAGEAKEMRADRRG